MSLIDLTPLTDEQLEELRIDVVTEQEPLARVAQAPVEIADRVRRYAEDGGDPVELLAALAEAVPQL